jgi:hypothetical protein
MVNEILCLIQVNAIFSSWTVQINLYQWQRILNVNTVLFIKEGMVYCPGIEDFKIPTTPRSEVTI